MMMDKNADRDSSFGKLIVEQAVFFFRGRSTTEKYSSVKKEDIYIACVLRPKNIRGTGRMFLSSGDLQLFRPWKTS